MWYTRGRQGPYIRAVLHNQDRRHKTRHGSWSRNCMGIGPGAERSNRLHQSGRARHNIPYRSARSRAGEEMTQALGRILLADDNATFLRSTSELLRAEGYHCDAVADATEARK